MTNVTESSLICCLGWLKPHPRLISNVVYHHTGKCIDVPVDTSTKVDKVKRLSLYYQTETLLSICIFRYLLYIQTTMDLLASKGLWSLVAIVIA